MARLAVRSRNRDSVTKSSVLMASLTPAFSRMAAFCSIRSSTSGLPPGLSGRVSETGIFRLASLVGDLVSLGAVLDDHLEAELFGEADDGHDVVGPMRMEMDSPLAIEHFDQRVERQVMLGLGGFLGLGVGPGFPGSGRRAGFGFLHGLAIGLPFAAVVEGLDELFALHCGQAHPRSWRLVLAAIGPLGVLAVGHLEAALGSAGLDHHVGDGPRP